MYLTEQEWDTLRKPGMTKEDISRLIEKRPNAEEFRKILLDARNNKDSINDISDVFWKMPNSMSENELEELCRFLLWEKWHHLHEDIVGSFQTHFNQSIVNIEVIEPLIDDLPPKFPQEGDLKYPFIRKCLYAIASQPKPESTESLVRLSHHNDGEVREYALSQLVKQKSKINDVNKE